MLKNVAKELLDLKVKHLMTNVLTRDQGFQNLPKWPNEGLAWVVGLLCFSAFGYTWTTTQLDELVSRSISVL